MSLIAFVGYSRIGYYQHRYLPRFPIAIEFNTIKSYIPKNSAILTTDHLAAHFSARSVIQNIEDNDYQPVSQYNYLIFPKLHENRSIQIREIIKSVGPKDIECDTRYHYFHVCKIQQ